MSNDIVIKDCPFCGSNNITDKFIDAYSSDSSYGFFGCDDCGVGFHTEKDSVTEKEIEEIWNKRN